MCLACTNKQTSELTAASSCELLTLGIITVSGRVLASNTTLRSSSISPLLTAFTRTQHSVLPKSSSSNIFFIVSLASTLNQRYKNKSIGVFQRYRCKVLVSHAYDFGFKPFPNKPWFLRVCSKGLFKTLWEKEKLLVTSNFSFSHSVFNPFGELPAIFIKFKIVVCKTVSIWKCLKFVIWERILKSQEDCNQPMEFNPLPNKPLLLCVCGTGFFFF